MLESDVAGESGLSLSLRKSSLMSGNIPFLNPSIIFSLPFFALSKSSFFALLYFSLSAGYILKALSITLNSSGFLSASFI